MEEEEEEEEEKEGMEERRRLSALTHPYQELTVPLVQTLLPPINNQFNKKYQSTN